jgi:protein SCO1/2
VQVLFVTLDPERDTVAVLKQYVPGFDPSFIGLTGSSKQIEAVAQQFKIYTQKQAGKDAQQYSIDHSAGAYVYDKQGRLRLYFKYAQSPEDMAHDLKLLM